MKFLIFSTLLFFSFSASAAEYAIDHTRSTISFSGTHAGNNFTGEFKEWRADITFDPNDLQNSFVKAVFQTASAKTGNAMYDGTLPQADWFDAKNSPEASFESTEITKTTEHSFQISGNLTIKGVKLPTTFPFELKTDEAGNSIARAEFPIDRIIYNIGKKSDPSAEWVSQLITLQLHIVATKK